MDSVIQLLASQLSGDAVRQISKQIGVDEDKAQQAVGMALPILIGALNRNTNTADGAQALTSALERDHDGSILDDLSQALTNEEVLEDGLAILGHVMGDRRSGFVRSVSRATGMDEDQVAQLFALLAPVVLGALGQMQRKKNLDAEGVSSLLQEERSTVEGTASGLVQLLDFDGDGDVSEEIIGLSSNLLGGLFKK